MVTLTQVVKKEERLVLDNWTTDGASKLVDLLHGFGEGSKIRNTFSDCVTTISLENRMISIQRRILSVVISRTVKLICT